MSDSSIDMPSTAEAAEGYRLVLENARRHIHCGETLSESQEFGMATSHMVLAAEETIKAVILLIVSLGVELPTRVIRPFLTQHLPRQIAGELWVFMDFLASQWINLIKSLDEKYSDKSGEYYHQARRRKVEELVAELYRLADAIPGESETIDVIDWWKDSNALKQHGLYVDFNAHAWKGPYSVTKEEFHRARKIANDALQSAEQIADLVSSQSPEGQRELLQTLNNILQQHKAARST